MEIAILIFERITALDAIGPYEVLSRLPGARVRFAGKRQGVVRTDNQMLGIVADVALADVSSADVVLVPGGFGVRVLETDSDVLDWLRKIHESTRWTTSVCTGSLLLGAAGLLDGLEATTHWAYAEELERHGAHYVPRRSVATGKIITGAGVSAGIDLALSLAALLAGERVAQSIQLRIEYDPDPPFSAGSPRTAPSDVRESVLNALRRRNDAAVA